MCYGILRPSEPTHTTNGFSELLLRICRRFRRILLQSQNTGVDSLEPDDLARGYCYEMLVGSSKDYTECAL